MEGVFRVRDAVVEYRIGFTRERELQDGVAVVLGRLGVPFEREWVLGVKDRVDFFLPGLGLALECKAEVSRGALGRQLARYARYTGVRVLGVVARRVPVLPAALGGKPVVAFELWKEGLL